MIFWGIGMGAQESILKAAVAELFPAEKRGTAFGLLNAVLGIFWFIGSAAMVYLYDVSIPWLIAFSVAAQAITLIILMLVLRKKTSVISNTAFCD